MSQSALSLYQCYLDRTGAALIARDAAAFLRHLFLPHTIETETDTIILDTPEVALRQINGFANALAAQGVDAYTRTARHAEFTDDTHLIGQHTCFITAKGKLVCPEFSNEIALERRDGVWGGIKTRHFTRFVSWPDILPRPETPHGR